MYKHRRALTLIEILVVITIIMILAAITAVVMSSAKKSAKRAGCMSNLEQLGMASLMYATDHDSYLPPYLTTTVGDPLTGLEAIGNVDRWKFCLYPYLSNDQVFFCPSDPQAGTGKSDEGLLGGNSRFTSYEHTPILRGTIVPPGFIMSDIDKEADREAAGYLQDRLKYIFDESTMKRRYASVHGETMSIWYLNGSAKHIKIED